MLSELIGVCFSGEAADDNGKDGPRWEGWAEVERESGYPRIPPRISGREGPEVKEQEMVVPVRHGAGMEVFG